ncbi:MAG: ABC transporter ATP-binding protein, partial [Candidatus Methanofastidiosia archaeon]
MKIIEVDSLTKYYEERAMLKKKRNRGIENITFDVNKGEIFGFLGPNGAGKTTTMRVLLDLLRPTSGKAKIFGKDSVEDSKIIKEQLGYIPGDINFYKAMTGGELLTYYEQLYGLPAPLKDELVKYFDIPLNRIVNGYSRGMKQKLAIIQAFMHDPDLVIMDEPTTGLDPLVQQKFYDFLISQKKRGKTIFISTHILAEAQKVCDRVAIIRNGRIVAIENVAEILARSGKIIKVK